MNADVVDLNAYRQARAALQEAESKTKTQLIDEFLLTLIRQEEAIREHRERVKHLGDIA